MADPIGYRNSERDIEQALIALKKGAQLIKYSRRGKPKFCPIRISPDETTLIWYSCKEERNLKLTSVLKIIPGQRTAVFKRYPCPEKDYLSFSLIYKNGERTLDLICRDKVEVEVWFSGLKALISTRYNSRRTKSYIPEVSFDSYIQIIFKLSGLHFFLYVLALYGALVCYSLFACGFLFLYYFEYFYSDNKHGHNEYDQVIREMFLINFPCNLTKSGIPFLNTEYLKL